MTAVDNMMERLDIIGDNVSEEVEQSITKKSFEDIY